ncbi:MAG: hypothetical protein LBJ31_02890 [Treponema sp.]|jgi:hypothetical protein|nr:hypothetical protein [Treponema sp.]
MCKKIFITLLFYCVFTQTASLAASERTLYLGGQAGWKMIEKRTQVEEFQAVRPRSVLALSSAWTASSSNGASEQAPGYDEVLALYSQIRNFPARESALDAALSFDEDGPRGYRDSMGNYAVEISDGVLASGKRWARYGNGAAVFAGGEQEVVLRPLRNALFAPGRSVRNFSIEFWLYPNTLENGEQILAWRSFGKQRIYCEAQKNRLQWSFQDFFAAPDERKLDITITSRTVVVPRKWSHHLIRYNADTGLLEYVINGRVEDAAYTTASARENGDVYTPLLSRDGRFELGGRFSGMLDEFRIYKRVIEAPGRTALEEQNRTALELPELSKFPRGGGRIETQAVDLGEAGSRLLRIEASGGTLGGAAGRRMTVKNTYTGGGNFRFADHSAVQFFVRSGEEPYRLAEQAWIPVMPSAAITAAQGRYVQIAAAFYPSGDCESSPYLETIKLVYDSNDPPWPPSMVVARAQDGAVELSWRSSPDSDTRGYLVYYGTKSGVYYGEGSPGASPLDAGNRTSLRIDGLRNGVLYFFAVAAYDGKGPVGFHEGKFSKETVARPLRSSVN